MKIVNIEISGISPLLINRFTESSELPVKMKKSNKKDYGTPREQAEKTAYKDEKSEVLWVPSTWIKGTLSTVSSDYKLPSSRKSVKSVIGGAVRPCEEKIYFKENYKLKDIEIDSRPCVIQKARIMKHRARLEKWTLNFSLEIEDDIIGATEVNEMLVDSGRRAGIGDFRPQKGGPFGRFKITSWKEQKS
ncbi:MAG TPA: hypothetical protein PK473_03115 [Nitrosomonas sp.]|nr:hypothetical protein [Agitococcus sp.]HNA70001.1 hypothetical protein [Nitrosomonas sp.]